LGFLSNAISADIKGNGKDKLDYTILVSEQEFVTAAVFTTNRVKAAPVKYNMGLLRDSKDKLFSGVVVNSGNANACTGDAGMIACADITNAIEWSLDLECGAVLICSTGVIGKPMPVKKMLDKVPELVEGLDDDNGKLFARAIMTTDTVKKEAAWIIETPHGNYTIGAACKGAGMVDPSMATVLGFITTDVDIDATELQNMLGEAVKNSFNCISVDGDRSTNDSCFVFANGMTGILLDTPELLDQFEAALNEVCTWMAKELVRDAEGATKFVKLIVREARSKEDALKCAAAIANSSLVKTMFAGCDPNWGRLMSSAGASGAIFEENDVDIWFDGLLYVSNGMIVDEALESEVYKIMNNPEYTITIELGAGDDVATYYTCDLTQEYVAINADYRS
ncbi:MAG: bifunctional glutamate N-acetyltransferase/amino-acid acetyltransferase ArgJ, partial [Deferribacteraceae bacterium]|nr:bifunctional glutamate N-acetyltransferase/amino-acid acetyltransferase ArgJ [Deferribacteraceae bacterium]